ncbi:hypothetical protein [Bacillus sp. MUM 13]|uniref:hypothetical protein n=1 Tax=Bacillus sp. MUM 13 TaxID=1678001 RepID=UPI0008F5D78E|nr:hypothetical protein [Bacillus sp. MUM 13]OIK11420.1 hypothetical protein BIV59_12195 [Bacillus sp. MUM 13]
MVLSRVRTHQNLKNKKKRRYRVYAGTVLLAAMIPYMSVPTYALLTDQVQETGQGVQAAFVFPVTIKELAEKAAELKEKMDTYAAEAESTAGKVSSSETAAGANSLVDSVVAKNSAAENTKKELEKVVIQLQDYYDRAQKEKDESKAIFEQAKSSDSLTGENLKQVQSLLGEATSRKNYGDESVAVDSDLLEKIGNKVKFYNRVYSYVESGFKKADKENTDADETLARLDSTLSSAQAAAAGVEERIKEEEKKKKEEEAKKQAEEAKKQEEAKQKEENPSKGEKSDKPESGDSGQEPKQGNDNGGQDASKGPAGSSDTSKGNPDPGKEDDSAKGTSEPSPAQPGNDDSAAGTDKSAP